MTQKQSGIIEHYIHRLLRNTSIHSSDQNFPPVFKLWTLFAAPSSPAYLPMEMSLLLHLFHEILFLPSAHHPIFCLMNIICVLPPLYLLGLSYPAMALGFFPSSYKAPRTFTFYTNGIFTREFAALAKKLRYV